VSEVEGIDYSPDGIEAIRVELSQLRQEGFNNWPESIPTTLILTHAIAQLARLRDMVKSLDDTDAYKLWLNPERTILVRMWKEGPVEVTFRQTSDHTWGPPIRLVPES
jgi:hypothetical protein